jgi:hypothetical protein
VLGAAISTWGVSGLIGAPFLRLVSVHLCKQGSLVLGSTWEEGQVTVAGMGEERRWWHWAGTQR